MVRQPVDLLGAAVRHEMFEGAHNVGVQHAPALLQETAVGHLVRQGMGESVRSEEHTSELQSLRHLVCRLLLEKKKRNKNIPTTTNYAKNHPQPTPTTPRTTATTQATLTMPYQDELNIA